MDEQAAPKPKPRSIGERLRAGRERSGLSVAAAAEKLHLDNKVIEALEADRFAELGASVYVRGHLRRYADFVGERGVEMVESYSAREARPAPPDLTQIPHAEHRANRRRLVTPLVGLGAALVLALTIWWVVAGSKSGASVSSETKTSKDVVSNIPTPATAAAPSSVDTPTMVADAGRSAAGAVPGGANTKGRSSATAAVDEAGAPARRDDGAATRVTRLKLELANDSWVEVYDSRGERLFYDVATAGSVQSMEGRPPLRVVLGSSGGVAVEVDGQRRDIPASAADGEGARFIVNRSGSLSRARQ